jgi:mannose/cellobiose epimerase-like protein (N-acyl-D-glucosamine 2-epimerase family)
MRRQQGLWLTASFLFVVVSRSSLAEDTDKRLAPFFRPPAELAGELGSYRSPLKFADGLPVKNPDDWNKRRQEILRTWHESMGAWPPLLAKPKIEYLQKERRDNLTQHHIRLDIAPDRTTDDAYLLVPDGKGPFPAVLVVFYDAATGIGRGKRGPNRDFAYQLARRGFVTLSLGSAPATFYPNKLKAQLQPLSFHAYVAANCHTALANLPQVDAQRIGVMGHSYGGKWAMFASCLYDKFACGVWSDPGIVFDEKRSNVNYWEPWYLGYEPGRERKPGIPSESNPRTGVYKKLIAAGHDLHELHALMAPRPFLVSGGAEDQPERWKALNHTIAVNELLGCKDRVAMTNRKGHEPTAQSNEQIYLFLDQVLKAEPSAEQRQANRCRQILKDSLVDFYLPACVDATNGGYLESLREGKFAGTGEKFVVLQARQLWFFSMLAAEGIRKESALNAAKAGFAFLEDHLRDRRHGGYFAKVSDTGEVKDSRKHVYLNAFALYGLLAYHRASGDDRALAAAKELFRVLEEKAHDRRHGGYSEFFTADWRPITEAKEPGYVGAIGTKTYNTHLHVMEALTDLYRAWPDPLVRERLAELLVINTRTVHHPDYNCNLDGWRPNWRMIEDAANQRASYGHDVECVWLALDASRALGLSPHLLRGWAEGLCSYSLKFGYDRRNGGFYYTGPLGRPAQDTRKEWWVQAEALVAMLEMSRLTGKREYDEVFQQTLDFVAKHQVAHQGGWWATRAADGSPQGATRTSPWQAAYHSGRAMIRCAKLLEERAKP